MVRREAGAETINCECYLQEAQDARQQRGRDRERGEIVSDEQSRAEQSRWTGVGEKKEDSFKMGREGRRG